MKLEREIFEFLENSFNGVGKQLFFLSQKGRKSGKINLPDSLGIVLEIYPDKKKFFQELVEDGFYSVGYISFKDFLEMGYVTLNCSSKGEYFFNYEPKSDLDRLGKI